MADELLRTAPPPPPHAAAAPPQAPRAATAAAVSCTAPRGGPAKNGGGAVAGRVAKGDVGGAADGDGGEWEEERHLDNAVYLLYRWVVVGVAVCRGGLIS